MKLDLMINGELIASTNFKHLYWSIAQQLAHHAVSGCNMKPGDMLGSGTISGEEKSSWGSLLELTWGGKEKINGTRTWLEDGDEVVISARCEREGLTVGFGQVSAKILPALDEGAYVSH